ncbi:MAG TPA: hypothetical protein VGE37_00165 [Archangium sp.]
MMLRIGCVALVLSVASSCKPACEQPIDAFCQEYTCRTLAEYESSRGPWDGGSCPSFSMATCGEYQVVTGGTYVDTALFFGPDGGLVAASQSSDVMTACGLAERSWGEVPACTIEDRTSYCSTR